MKNEIISFEDFNIESASLTVILDRYKTKFITNYLKETGEYPTIEMINSVTIPEEELENYKKMCYSKYLASISTKIQEEEFNNYLNVYFDIDGKPNNYEFDENGGTIKLIIDTNNGWEIESKCELSSLYNAAGIDVMRWTGSDEDDLYHPIFTSKGNDKELIINVEPYKWLKTDELSSGIPRIDRFNDRIPNSNKSDEDEVLYPSTNLTSTQNIIIKPSKGDRNNKTICTISQRFENDYNYNVLRNEFEWMETPLLNDENMQYFWYEKGYSFCWSPKYRCSMWVAFPMDGFNGKLLFPGVRSLKHDPLIESSDIFDDSTLWASNYSPCCFCHYESVRRYHSNIYLINKDVYESSRLLESDLFNYLRRCYGIAYVVRGIIIDETYKINDIFLPNKLYTTVLYYDKTYDNTGWKSSAIIVDLLTAEVSIMSLSELEKITGITYYPLLSKMIDQSEYNTVKSVIDDKVYRYLYRFCNN